MKSIKAEAHIVAPLQKTIFLAKFSGRSVLEWNLINGESKEHLQL